jgi:hypothetical protein
MTIQQRIKILFGKEVTSQHAQNLRWDFVSPAAPQHKHQLALVRRLSQHLEEKKRPKSVRSREETKTMLEKEEPFTRVFLDVHYR